ncbi:hypothetical protein [Empedobacter brevis]|uniref:hypothetical protein n=1 Tax=Empedobacter brevis TaxID=247 RepID=UPI0028964722|nr:hypothetical protein [Empedobacter brevis]
MTNDEKIDILYWDLIAAVDKAKQSNNTIIELKLPIHGGELLYCGISYDINLINKEVLSKFDKYDIGFFEDNKGYFYIQIKGF